MIHRNEHQNKHKFALISKIRAHIISHNIFFKKQYKSGTNNKKVVHM